MYTTCLWWYLPILKDLVRSLMSAMPADRDVGRILKAASTTNLGIRTSTL